MTFLKIGIIMRLIYKIIFQKSSNIYEPIVLRIFWFSWFFVIDYFFLYIKKKRKDFFWSKFFFYLDRYNYHSLFSVHEKMF